MHKRVFVLLASLGLFVPACHAATDLGQSGSALEDDPDLSAFFASKEYSALDGRVATEVRQTLLASMPAGASRSAMLALFRAPKWLMLGSVNDPTSCPVYGVDLQVALVDWLKTSLAPLFGETTLTADQRTASNAAAAKRLLASQNVMYLNGTVANLASGLADAKPLFSVASCGGSPAQDAGPPATKGTSEKCTGVGTTEVCGPANNPPSNADGGTPDPPCTWVGTTMKCGDPSPKGTTRASLDTAPGEASLALADLFAQTEAAAPSRGMLAEWSAIRARWQSTVGRVERAPIAHDRLLAARRLGSMTLAREGVRASMKFDQAAGLVDQLVRHEIAFSSDAMRTVHAIVADRAHGEIRRAGQNVQAGRSASRSYLPGAEVAPAVASLFAGVRRGSANGMATPEVAARFDQRLISIHPFLDANGRTTRLMTDWLLLQGGFPPGVEGRDIDGNALFAQQSRVDRQLHLERMTARMQHALALVDEALS